MAVLGRLGTWYRSKLITFVVLNYFMVGSLPLFFFPFSFLNLSVLKLCHIYLAVVGMLGMFGLKWRRSGSSLLDFHHYRHFQFLETRFLNEVETARRRSAFCSPDIGSAAHCDTARTARRAAAAHRVRGPGRRRTDLPGTDPDRLDQI